MSNPIRYDTLLVRYLALELNERFAGRSLAAVQLDREGRRILLDLETDALVWELHPNRGDVRLAPASGGVDPGQGGVPRLPRRAVIREVHAVPDERVLLIELGGSGKMVGRARRIVVELLTNQWNAMAVDPAGRVLNVLRHRQGGARPLHTGAEYAPPPSTDRAGREQPISSDDWRALLEAVPAAQRARALVGAVAWMSPFNASAIFGEGDDALDEAYARYVAIASLPAPSPCLIETERGAQPYPLPLPGREVQPAVSLLDAIAAAADVSDAETAAPADQGAASAETLRALDRRLARLDKRASSLRAEFDGASPEAAGLRSKADLLLSQLGSVQKGATEAVLSDFAGGTVTVELDPSLEPAENARRLYDAAKKRERAAERLPALIEKAENERAELAELRRRAEAGEASPDELQALAATPGAAADGPKQQVVALPYRRYRTSGGLEVRVGRGSRSNDELTFRHSSPEDVWLHAREAAGAHVILRWSDAGANPPLRDLQEAAVLAALNSRARTSGTVAVDWTRRKYVRKPRKAMPGTVIPERVKTVFVEPDERVEERLRASA